MISLLTKAPNIQSEALLKPLLYPLPPNQRSSLSGVEEEAAIARSA